MMNGFTFFKRVFLFEDIWHTSFSGQTEDVPKLLIEGLPDLKFYQGKLLIFPVYQKIDSFNEKIDLQIKNDSNLNIGKIQINFNFESNIYNVKLYSVYSPLYIFIIISSLFFLGLAFYWVKTTILISLFLLIFFMHLFSSIIIIIETKKVLSKLKNYILSKIDSVK